MYRLRPIDSLELPELAPYRSMRQQTDHLGRGVFVAEGEKLVRRLLETSFEVRSILLPPKWVGTYEALLDRREGCPDVFVAPLETLQDLAGFSMYQGVLALASVPPSANIDELRRLPTPRLIVALDGLTNAENVGAVVRSAVGLGVQAVVCGETSAHPYLRRAVRSSMGAIFKVPHVVVDDLETLLRTLRRDGIRVVGAHPHVPGEVLGDESMAGDTCVVLGSEGDGLRASVLAACDVAVRIPMAAEVDSLNVGAAAAAFFCEAQRQRRAVGTRRGA